MNRAEYNQGLIANMKHLIELASHPDDKSQRIKDLASLMSSLALEDQLLGMHDEVEIKSEISESGGASLETLQEVCKSQLTVIEKLKSQLEESERHYCSARKECSRLLKKIEDYRGKENELRDCLGIYKVSRSRAEKYFKEA